MAIEAGDDTSVRVRFERDVTAQSDGNGRWRDPPSSVFSGSAQAGMTLSYGGETELVRFLKAARCETAIEMPQSRNDHSDDRDLDVGPGLIEDEEIEACASGDIDAGEH